MSKPDLAKTYSAQEVEDRIYQKWEKSGCFAPEAVQLLAGSRKAESFTIAMPPPNATGILHTGHAVMLAIEDLMIRHARMNGRKALWVPGTDHAAIATQTKVEKIIAKEGLTRHQLGREKFLARVKNFVDGSRGTIRKQIRKMGSSCDWSRERFTLDAGLNKAVREAFVRMYNDGLIYRGDRVVNWCPRCHSTLADDEVEYQSQKAGFYTFKYSADFPLAIATTRPETKLGDTAVAVNPKDERYKKYIGQTFEVDFVGVPLKIKIIADGRVDSVFGTGVLGVTPAHSLADYQMAQENNLPIVKVIDEDGKIVAGFGAYSGLDVISARKLIVKKLKESGLMIKEEEMENNLSVCYRCGSVIEPLPSKQWFVAVDKPFKLNNKTKLKWKKNEATLKELAIHAVRSGLIQIVPEKFEKVYLHWMENLRDWCISRQIWYGHQIPVWFNRSRNQKINKTKNQIQEDIFVGREKPARDNWEQDPDTLDTWFSSALWTFSTLGWPAETDDLKTYHPTAVMETGYDILFFWVARMILMSAYCLNDIPFRHVYLHGMVRAEDGAKMSKSLDNAVDPIEVIEKYGADALRMAMLLGVTPGNDLRLYDEKVAGYRNFVNKLWNISRFVLQSVEKPELIGKMPKAETLADKWITGRLKTMIDAVNDNLAVFQFSAAGEAIEKFIWDDFADWYLEVYKVEKSVKSKEELLLYILQMILKLLHPFCPFVTEEIWSYFGSENMLIVESWPSVKVKLNEKNISDFELIKFLIGGIRNLRSENKIEPVKMISLVVISGKNDKLIKSQIEIIKKLARVDKIDFVKAGAKPENAVGGNAIGIEFYISLEGLVDVETEKKRLTKEIAETEKYVKSLEMKLKNKEFVQNAPKAVVDKEKDKLLTYQEKLLKLKSQFKDLK